MNLIPFVFVLLLVFALFASSAFEGLKFTKTLHREAIKQQKLVLQFTNAAEKKAFEKVKRSEQDKSEEKRPKSKTLAGVYFRNRAPTHDLCKFNLSCFLDDPHGRKSHLLYEPAARLIAMLYEHSEFWQEGLSYKIVDRFLEAKEKKLTVSDLFADNPQLANIFYLMTQGTSSYKLGTRQGYPSFWDYFTLEKGSISFRFAKKPVMEAILGPKDMIALEKEEKENRNRFLEKEKLDKLFSKTASTSPWYNDRAEIFFFGKQQITELSLAQDFSSDTVLRR